MNYIELYLSGWQFCDVIVIDYVEREVSKSGRKWEVFP